MSISATTPMMTKWMRRFLLRGRRVLRRQATSLPLAHPSGQLRGANESNLPPENRPPAAKKQRRPIETNQRAAAGASPGMTARAIASAMHRRERNGLDLNQPAAKNLARKPHGPSHVGQSVRIKNHALASAALPRRASAAKNLRPPKLRLPKRRLPGHHRLDRQPKLPPSQNACPRPLPTLRFRHLPAWA